MKAARSIGLNIVLPHEQMPNPLCHAGPQLPVPLFRAAQDALPAARARRRGVPGRLRHVRRNVRAADPDPDRQGAAAADPAVRPRFLEPDGQFRGACRGGRDLTARPRPHSLVRGCATRPGTLSSPSTSTTRMLQRLVRHVGTVRVHAEKFRVFAAALRPAAAAFVPAFGRSRLCPPRRPLAGASPGFAAAAAAGAAGSGFGRVAVRVEEGDHVGAVLRIAEAGEGHLRAGRERLRAGQPLGEIVPVPVAALLGQRVGESEARPLPTGSPSTPHRFGPSWLAPPLSALWQAAHFLKTSLALRRIGAGEVELDRLARPRRRLRLPARRPRSDSPSFRGARCETARPRRSTSRARRCPRTAPSRRWC